MPVCGVHESGYEFLEGLVITVLAVVAEDEGYQVEGRLVLGDRLGVPLSLVLQVEGFPPPSELRTMFVETDVQGELAEVNI